MEMEFATPPQVSSPLIRLNPWDRISKDIPYGILGFIASNSAQSVGLCGRTR